MLSRRALLGAAAGLARAQPRRPNVLFLLSDDQRHDTIRTLGNPVIRTPHLDRLARTGTAFTHCFVANPICTPSRATVLTGRNDFRNGVRFFNEKIRPGLPLWPEVMREAGYTTFYTGKWHNDGHPADRGFQVVRNLFPRGMGDHRMTLGEGPGKVTGYSSELFADAAIEFLDSRPAQPFCAFVCFTAPHDPRTPHERYANLYQPADIPLPKNFLPEHPFDNGEMKVRDEQLLPWPRTPEAIRKERAGYYAMISHLDEQVGRILEALERNGQAGETIVLFAADNGLAIGSHGLLGKQNMYDHSVRVPLLIRAPGVGRPGRRSDGLCYLHDLFPTVCELAGVAAPGDLDGRSLRPLLANPDAPRFRDAVFASYRDVQRMVRTERWKLIHYPKADRMQLFDLRGDPEETRDLAASPKHRRIVATLREKLREHQTGVGDVIA